MYKRLARSTLLCASALTFTSAAGHRAVAQDSAGQLGTIERQIQALQAELRHVKQQLADRDRVESRARNLAERSHSRAVRQDVQAPGLETAAPSMPAIPPGYALVPASPGSKPGTVVLAEAEAPPAKKLGMGEFQVGGVTVTLGGFIEAAGIFRTRNEVADIASNFNTGIPFGKSPLYHENEFRATARQSRFSALAVGKPDDVTTISAFAETDFISAAPTANNVESNSYNLRIRHLYATYDRSDLGLEVLGGQTWSLLTMDRVGIMARKENIPVQIDAQYIPGFTWARQAQVRVAKSFDDQHFWLAASLESPQTNYYTGPSGLAPSAIGTLNITNPGGSGYASTTNYSDDIAPDVIVKAAADFEVAHLEAYGLGRVFHDRLSQLGDGTNKSTFGGGGGAAALVHIVPKVLDIQASFLAGDGIGRYGTSQLPDAVVGADGAPVALPEVEALFGIIGHPIPTVDIYGYGGTEQISSRYFSTDVKGKPVGYGYGSPLYSNAGCNIELSEAPCVGNTSGIVQGTAGFWWRFLKGSYGTMQVGTQYSYTHRSVFAGIGPTPKTDENMLFFSFRYYPFQ